MNLLRISLPAAILILLGACDAGAPTPVDPDSPAARITDVQTGYVVGLNGQPIRVAYEVRRGLAIREGDIVLGYADSIANSPQELKQQLGAHYAVILNNPQRWWTGGVVWYIISVNLPNPQRVLDAIEHIETNTPGIDFRALTESQTQGKNFIRFVWAAAGCDSQIGMVGGPQAIYLADGCPKGHVIHELGHALGMQHEHTRCNRDDFVEILAQNIRSDKLYNFDKNCADRGYQDIGTYSEGSIMHYDDYEWSANGQPTIRSHFGREAQMGQRTLLNSSDISSLSAMYPALTQVHRWYNPNKAGGDHLYTLNPDEGWAHGYTLEDGDYFRVTSATSTNYGRLFRCLVNNHHYLSRDPSCEAGLPAEGLVGRVATWQMGKTVPLYRTRNPYTGDRLATTSASERTATLNAGWVNEGILGYVWPGN